MVILLIMTLNVLEYIRKILNLKILIYLYSRYLYYPNIIYIVTRITSFSFEDLRFLIVSKITGISDIEKTIVFVHNTKKSRNLKIFLKSSIR